MGLGRQSRIKDQLKLLCRYSSCKSGLARKKLFMQSSAGDQRKLVSAVHNCSKQILARGKQLQPGLPSHVRKLKQILKKIVNTSNYPWRSALVRNQLGKGLLGLLAKRRRLVSKEYLRLTKLQVHTHTRTHTVENFGTSPLWEIYSTAFY